MFIKFKYILITVLLSLTVPVFSFEPSGGVLLLDGEDDYAILPFVEHGYIFPEGTHEFTVEVWFYPKTKPEQKDRDLILTQQVSLGLTTKIDCGTGKNQVCLYRHAYLEGERANGLAGSDTSIEKDQWHYVAIIFKNSTLYFASNDQIREGQRLNVVDQVQADLRGRPIRLEDFFVGGYSEDQSVFNGGQLLYQVTCFHGAIDAIRFSNIARYDLPDAPGMHPFEPPHRFLSDAHTLALWNFDEEEGATLFQDESGNGRTLVGMNGAAVSDGADVNLNRNPEDGLEVRPENSLTTIWGKIKSQ